MKGTLLTAMLILLSAASGAIAGFRDVTPIPEPGSTIAFAVLALLGLASLRLKLHK